MVGAPLLKVGANILGATRRFMGSADFKNYQSANGDLTIGTVLKAQYGYSVAGIGDVDKDGKPDFVVGAPFANNGSLYLVSSVGGLLMLIGTGSALNDEFGSCVSGIGDVNGDGKGDYVVGAPGQNVVYLFGGATPVEHTAGVVGDKFGVAVSGVSSLK